MLIFLRGRAQHATYLRWKLTRGNQDATSGAAGQAPDTRAAGAASLLYLLDFFIRTAAM